MYMKLNSERAEKGCNASSVGQFLVELCLLTKDAKKTTTNVTNESRISKEKKSM